MGPCTGAIRITITQTASGAYIATVRKGNKPPKRHKSSVILVLAHGTFTIRQGKTTTIKAKLSGIGSNLADHHLNVKVRIAATGAKKPIEKVVRWA
jgi:hypothetical protein